MVVSSPTSSPICLLAPGQDGVEQPAAMCKKSGWGRCCGGLRVGSRQCWNPVRTDGREALLDGEVGRPDSQVRGRNGVRLAAESNAPVHSSAYSGSGWGRMMRSRVWEKQRRPALGVFNIRTGLAEFRKLRLAINNLQQTVSTNLGCISELAVV